MEENPNAPQEWELRSEHEIAGHTLRMYQRRYMLVLQMDNLYFVAWVSDFGNIMMPGKMVLADDLDAAKAICDDSLAQDDKARGKDASNV